MKRTALRRRTPLKPGTSSLKRTELKRGGELKRTPVDDGVANLRDILPDGVSIYQYISAPLRTTPLPKTNAARAKKARDRDFGPHGNIIIPRLPCAVCYPWWYARTDEVVREAMGEVFAEPERFAVVSEPAHTKSRGAGGDRTVIVPGCAPCHAVQHTSGVKTFAAAHPDVDLTSLAARLWRLSPAREMEADDALGGC